MTSKKVLVERKIKRKVMARVLLSSGIGISITAAVAGMVYAQSVEHFKTMEDKKLERPVNFDSFPAFIRGMNQEPARTDSDNNGLRDDIQLKIAYQYPFDANKRAALIQYYESLIQLLRLNTEMRELKISYGIMQVNKALKCLQSEGVPEDVSLAIKEMALDRDALLVRHDEILAMEPNLPPELFQQRIESDCNLLLQNNEQSLQSWVPND